MPPWANNASAAIGRGMAGITATMWPRRRRRRYHHKEWVWVAIFFLILFWAGIWLALETVMIALWVLVAIAGGLHELALLTMRPLRRERPGVGL
jgi:hypothetical protein